MSRPESHEAQPSPAQPGSAQPGAAQPGARFSEQASGKRRGLVAEFGDFLMENKKWWLGPIVISILLLGALVFLSGTAAAPFIYTLF